MRASAPPGWPGRLATTCSHDPRHATAAASVLLARDPTAKSVCLTATSGCRAVSLRRGDVLVREVRDGATAVAGAVPGLCVAGGRAGVGVKDEVVMQRGRERRMLGVC